MVELRKKPISCRPVGFELDTLWARHGGLARMTRNEGWRHLLGLSFSNVRRSPFSTLLTVITMTLALLMVGVLVTILLSLRKPLVESDATVPITAFISDAVQSAELLSLVESARTKPGVVSVTVRDRIEALRDLEVALPDAKEILAGLEDNNPLPRSVIVEVQQEGGDAARIFGIGEFLRRDIRVEHVAYDRALVGEIFRVSGLVRVGGALLIGFALLVAIFMVATTIQLGLYAHREELSIMGLLGAPRYLMRGPFLLEGLLAGLLGGLVSAIVLGMIASTAGTVLTQIAPALQGIELELSLLVLLSLIVGGATVGFLGSGFALYRFGRSERI